MNISKPNFHILLLSLFLICACSNVSEKENNEADDEEGAMTSQVETEGVNLDRDVFLSDFSSFKYIEEVESETYEDFSGSYSITLDDGTYFSVRLTQKGNKVTGSYCGYSQNYSDCGMESQGAPDCPVKGIVADKTLYVQFIGCYTPAVGKAIVTKSGSNLNWETTEYPSGNESLVSYSSAPSTATLINRAKPSELIIIGGGKKEVDAKKVVDEFNANKELSSLFNNNINIALSDTINGLNKGFYIATTGYTPYQSLSDLAITLANKYTSGVYKKEVLLKSDQQKALKEIQLKDKSGSLSGRPVLYNDEEIKVKDNAKPIYIERKGSFDINHYLAWSGKTKMVLVLSALDYDPIFSSTTLPKKNVHKLKKSTQTIVLTSIQMVLKL